MTANHLTANGTDYRRPRRPVVVVCLDGGDPAYIHLDATSVQPPRSTWGGCPRSQTADAPGKPALPGMHHTPRRSEAPPRQMAYRLRASRSLCSQPSGRVTRFPTGYPSIPLWENT